MCFSAEADLVAGLGIGVVGIDALRHVRLPAERAIALLPVVLGAHLLVESVVWRGLEGSLSEAAWRSAMTVYLLIAFGLLPVLVPIAVGALDVTAAHRARVRWMTGIGTLVAGVLTYAVARGPVEASIEGHHIAYRVDLSFGGTLVVLYVLVTCGSLIASKHRKVRLFGALNLAVVALLVWLDQSAFISLWCAWAAITSIAIAAHLRTTPAPSQAAHH